MSCHHDCDQGRRCTCGYSEWGWLMVAALQVAWPLALLYVGLILLLAWGVLNGTEVCG